VLAVEDEKQRATPAEVLARLCDGGSTPYIVFREHKWEVCDPFAGTDKADAATFNLRPASFSLAHPKLLVQAHRSWRKHYVQAKLLVKKNGKEVVLWRTFWLGPDGTPEYIPDVVEKKTDEGGIVAQCLAEKLERAITSVTPHGKGNSEDPKAALPMMSWDTWQNFIRKKENRSNMGMPMMPEQLYMRLVGGAVLRKNAIPKVQKAAPVEAAAAAAAAASLENLDWDGGDSDSDSKPAAKPTTKGKTEVEKLRAKHERKVERKPEGDAAAVDAQKRKAEAEQRKADDAEAKRQREEAVKQKAQQEMEKQKAQQEAEKKKREQEAAEAKKRKAEAPAAAAATAAPAAAPAAAASVESEAKKPRSEALRQQLSTAGGAPKPVVNGLALMSQRLSEALNKTKASTPGKAPAETTPPAPAAAAATAAAAAAAAPATKPTPEPTRDVVELSSDEDDVPPPKDAAATPTPAPAAPAPAVVKTPPKSTWSRRHPSPLARARRCTSRRKICTARRPTRARRAPTIMHRLCPRLRLVPWRQLVQRRRRLRAAVVHTACATP
jgi:hypothetical protein